MTETKKTNLPEPIPVDSKKLIDGLGTIFGGVIQLLNSMEPGMAQQLADMAINGVAKETVPETINPDEFEEILILHLFGDSGVSEKTSVNSK